MIESIGQVLYQWYKDYTLFYASASVLIMLVAGVILGLIADLVARLLGANIGKLEHERKKVK
jgi:hypothetical protein